MRGIGGRRAAAAVATILLFVVTLLDAGLATPAGAAISGVALDARVDGQRVRDSSEIRPIRLSPKRSALLVVEVTNNSNRPIDVRIIRLEGKVVGLTFFAYDTAVAMTVAPGAKGTRRFPLDLGGLDGQATGLIPGSVKLLDPDRKVVAEEAGVVDVRGSLFSVYGLFGIGVAVLTVISFLGALIGLARHRLPQNRWRRALRFMTPGIGLGLLLNFTLSATRVFVPGVGRWLTIVVVSALVFFGLGYLTPTPDLGEEEEEEEEPLALPARPAAPALEAPPPQPVLEQPARPAELEAPEEPALPAPDDARALPLAEVGAVAVEPAPEPSTPAPPTEIVEPLAPKPRASAPATEAVGRLAPELPEPPAAAPAPAPAPASDVAAPLAPLASAPATEAVARHASEPPVPPAAPPATLAPLAPEPLRQAPAPATEAVAPPAPEPLGQAPAPPTQAVDRFPIVVPCHLPPESPDDAAATSAHPTIGVPPVEP